MKGKKKKENVNTMMKLISFEIGSIRRPLVRWIDRTEKCKGWGKGT